MTKNCIGYYRVTHWSRNCAQAVRVSWCSERQFLFGTSFTENVRWLGVLLWDERFPFTRSDFGLKPKTADAILLGAVGGPNGINWDMSGSP